jgi:adenylate kinase
MLEYLGLLYVFCYTLFKLKRIITIMIILISGTPGTGKTTIAESLSLKLVIPSFNVHNEALRLGLVEGKDMDRDADIINETEIEKIVIDLCKNNNSFILEGLLSHYALPIENRLCIVVKCNISVLNERLSKRGYSNSKIRENLDSEIFCIIENEAMEKGHNVYAFDNSSSLDKNMEKILKKIKDFQDSISSK